MKHTHKQIICQVRISWYPVLGCHSLRKHQSKVAKSFFKIMSLMMIVFLFNACASIKEISIDTLRPAEVIYPAYTHKVVVVNNAVMQPYNIGHTITSFGNPAELCNMSTDSVMYDACQVLAQSLDEQKFFRKIAVANQPTRQDEAYFRDTKLTKEQVNTICNQAQADALISIDKMLFNGKLIVDSEAGYIMGSQRVDVTAVYRAYLPDRVNPLATILINDSLEWLEAAPNLESIQAVLPSPNKALRITASYISSKVSENFVPHWITEKRSFYISTLSSWKEASVFASKGKWADAYDRWEVIYNQTKSETKQAKAASNLALSCEMAGAFDEALKWIILAIDHFEKAYPNQTNKQKSRALLYKEILENRILADKKLNIQLDNE